MLGPSSASALILESQICMGLQCSMWKFCIVVSDVIFQKLIDSQSLGLVTFPSVQPAFFLNTVFQHKTIEVFCLENTDQQTNLLNPCGFNGWIIFRKCSLSDMHDIH